ncbi:hypothetical protein TKK_0007579 [Trichogramma kaykai]|uniref:DUF7041 domain-containing protein n=1 Tax=Trichogramma kaykai TaxID=54128 RepID=A0ABD2WFZ4_9HYME
MNSKGTGRGYSAKDSTRESSRLKGFPGPSFQESAALLENAKKRNSEKKTSEEESPYQSIDEDSDPGEKTIVDVATEDPATHTNDQNINKEPPAARMTQNKCDLPRFWRSAPKAWFVQAECLFAAKSVTEDNEKFNLLVGAFDQDTAVELMDVIDPPPSENKYKTLKEAIVHRTTDSTEKQLQD